MEAIFAAPSSPDQSKSPYASHPLISRFSSQNLAFRHIHGGLLHAPPPSPSLFNHNHFFDHHLPQPPLLPLPISMPHNSLPPPQSRAPNCRNLKKTRNQSLTPKKSKPIKREEAKRNSKPYPNHLPKDASGMLSNRTLALKNLEMVPGSEFTIMSPPPSSLPLPKFSLRPKLTCNAEAAGIDACATDNSPPNVMSPAKKFLFFSTV